MSGINLHFDSESRKALYQEFCDEVYVPIYSKPWWMDAVCGQENWDVWLHEDGSGRVDAAMPYYLERREHGLYITKAPLTQTNGITFRHATDAGPIARSKFEEHVVADAASFLETLHLAVYEQQYQSSFSNWLPFRWKGFMAEPRYTYVIDANRTCDLDAAWGAIDAKKRSKVRKGQRSCTCGEGLDALAFYSEVEAVFAKQGLSCPLSRNVILSVVEAATAHHAGKVIYAAAPNGRIASTVLLVWDERSVYQLVSGGSHDMQHLEGKSALVWEGIKFANEMGLAYDFEGSVIERIAHSNRLFGAEPKLYFRIRKVYSPEVILAEATARADELRQPTSSA